MHYLKCHLKMDKYKSDNLPIKTELVDSDNSVFKQMGDNIPSCSNNFGQWQVNESVKDKNIIPASIDSNPPIIRNELVTFKQLQDIKIETIECEPLIYNDTQLVFNKVQANFIRNSTRSIDRNSLVSTSDSKCIQCSERDQPLRSLNAKKDKYEDTDSKQMVSFKCSECDKTFPQRYRLIMHNDAVHQKTRKFACTYCNKMFVNKAVLNIHTNRVHRKIRKFKCNECAKMFARNCDLTEHVDGVHRKIRGFKCSECNNTFSQKSNLNKHIDVIHRKIRKFICDDCDKMFARKSDLTKHIDRMHLGVRKSGH